MKNKHTHIGLLAILLCALISCQTATDIKKMSVEMKRQINEDTRLDSVKHQAERLLQEGLNAGDNYNEIWIRDLNTFIELACEVGEVAKVRNALLNFFRMQGADGNIVDGYVPKESARIWYKYIYSDLAPDYAAHKNTVETDQESSLIQSIAKYIKYTGDETILKDTIGGKTVEQRMEDALSFLMQNRYNEQYGLLWGATTADWGDVQPEHEWGVELDSTSHICIDIYDNAMFVIALNDYMSLTDGNKAQWTTTKERIVANIRQHLWDEERQKFIPHLYIDGSPFPADFDENAIHYHGGTAVAIEAGILDCDEILTVYKQMQENVKQAGAQSIGLTLWPVYPNGYFKNPWMTEHYYQNGGDWTWFGGRMVQQLTANNFYDEAYEAISPMLDRVIVNNGFFEWYTPDGIPNSGNFKGSAGVLWKAINMFREQAAI